MKCLVTGGTGFIGSNLALKLLNDGHNVTITGKNYEQKDPKLFEVISRKDFPFLKVEDLKDYDVIFHQAAITDTSVDDKEEMFDVNVISSLRLFKNAIKAGVKKIVYASSTAVYGDIPAPYKENNEPKPLNIYGESKKVLDKLVTELSREYNETTIIGLRYCNIYGPRENHKGKSSSMICQLAQQMKNANPKIFKYGEQKRDWLYVDDCVEANLLASQSKESCIVNCGSGKATTFNEIIGILNEVIGTNRKPQYINNPYEFSYQNHTECDLSLVKEKIGFVPKFNIRDGIKEYYESGFLTA